MNRIVRERYPVADLPEDLREGLPADANVKVVVEYEASSPGQTKPRVSLEELFAMAQPSFYSLEEVADHIRAIRDEWD